MCTLLRFFTRGGLRRITTDTKDFAVSNVKPKEPVFPQPHECCGNGCDDCVLVTYFDEQKKYLRLLKAWETTHGKDASEGL